MNRSERRLGGWRQFAVVTALGAVASPPMISDAGRQSATDRIALAVDTSKTGAKIDRNIFGQFAEHLGRGIYEGVWVGPDSPIPNTRASATTSSPPSKRSRCRTCDGRAAASLMNITGARASDGPATVP